jgi:hypothetical protein
MEVERGPTRRKDDSPSPYLGGADGADFIVATLDYLRRSLSSDLATSGTPPVIRQKQILRQWAECSNRILNCASLPQRIVRGGQEHDIFHDEREDRYFKVTRDGLFGLTPGIELALVSSDRDPRRFHLWEASPIKAVFRESEFLITNGFTRYVGYACLHRPSCR